MLSEGATISEDSGNALPGGQQGKIFVVDDEQDIRDSLCVLLEMVGYSVTTYARAGDFLSDCKGNCLGCIILDVNIPDMRGPEVQAELLRRNIRIPIIFLSGYGTVPDAVNAMRRGAVDFLSKPVPGRQIIGRVKEAIIRSQSILRQEDQRCRAETAVAELTSREKEVMNLLVAGHSNKEVAMKLAISDRTVENHRAHIMFKTKTSNLLELSRISLFASSHIQGYAE